MWSFTDDVSLRAPQSSSSKSALVMPLAARASSRESETTALEALALVMSWLARSRHTKLVCAAASGWNHCFPPLPLERALCTFPLHSPSTRPFSPHTNPFPPFELVPFGSRPRHASIAHKASWGAPKKSLASASSRWSAARVKGSLGGGAQGEESSWPRDFRTAPKAASACEVKEGGRAPATEAETQTMGMKWSHQSEEPSNPSGSTLSAASSRCARACSRDAKAGTAPCFVSPWPLLPLP
mmetsp:Transcript_83019/g.166096  ORF Transcript_83019/g.166096 Transcript_83019/m.166096 type:complete len:241 (-) Transcript_83019:1612-2334(-)